LAEVYVCPTESVCGGVGTIAIMQIICGLGSEGNEFQHPTGVMVMVAEDDERLASVKYALSLRISAMPPGERLTLAGAFILIS
jgi:hypothetical protein